MIEVGTRTRANTLSIAPPQGTTENGTTRDVGMSKRAAASMTFGSGEVSAANGTFAAFVVGDLVFANGTNENDGFFTVTAVDGANHAFLTLEPAPKAEGPVTAVMRTA